jgi:short-subunit dehydrogenase
MTGSELTGKTALVTGASSGLGVDFARELASRGCSIILVARREELLRQVQAEIEQKYAVGVSIIAMDLGAEAAPQDLYERIRAAGQRVDILVNNAGFGLYGEFTDIPWARQREMLQIDIITLAHLTRLFASDMQAQGYGRILQVASTGAYQPTPMYAAYAAAKSFVLNFGIALNYELRQTNVRCTVISPGVTATEFLKVSGQKPSLFQRLTMMQSPVVARIGVNAMLRGRAMVIPGTLNALSAWSTRSMPRPLTAMVAHRLMTTP